MTLRTEFEQAISALTLSAEDTATVELARTYAGAIEDGGDLTKLGPALLSCLESLGMTPRARAALKKGGTADVPARSQLDQLAERRAGKSRTTDLDATAT